MCKLFLLQSNKDHSLIYNMTSYNQDLFDIHQRLPSTHSYHGGLHMAYRVPYSGINKRSNRPKFGLRIRVCPRWSLPCKLHSCKHSAPTYILDLSHTHHDVPMQYSHAHGLGMDALVVLLAALESRVWQNSCAGISKCKKISFL